MSFGFWRGRPAFGRRVPTSFFVKEGPGLEVDYLVKTGKIGRDEALRLIKKHDGNRGQHLTMDARLKAISP